MGEASGIASLRRSTVQCAAIVRLDWRPYASSCGFTAEVVGVRRDGDTTFVTVRTDAVFHPPLAPSSLHFDDGTTVHLDVVVSTDDHTAEFRTNATALTQSLVGLLNYSSGGRPTPTTLWLMSDAPGSLSA
ncbi:MAG: hypothetical protein R2710_22580 [Acidimicrobiales bacterium]